MNPERQIVLEIGMGNKPFPITGIRTIKAYESYLGLDLDRKDCVDAREQLNQRHVPSDIFVADARRLPLARGCVSEVVACNVLGDWRLRKDISGILREIKRVLKPGGKLTIVETFTPQLANFSLVRKNGFQAIDDGGKGTNRKKLKEYKYGPNDHHDFYRLHPKIKPVYATFTKESNINDIPFRK